VSESPVLRSAAWLEGDDEVALNHRAALRASGLAGGRRRPLIGIASTASDLNRCDRGLTPLAAAVREGVLAAGGLPLSFPVMSLSEDLIKPTAMMYRNLLAIEVEETIRSQPLDGVVLLGNCDKSVPAFLMALASADIPSLVVTGGFRPVPVLDGVPLGSGTSLWRKFDERRAGTLPDRDWARLETCLGAGIGACNTMGTASTMAIMAETLGMTMPGSAVIQTGDAAQAPLAEAAGRRAVSLVLSGVRPSSLLTAAAFERAIAVLAAIGGSTNAIIHLCAIAGRRGVALPLPLFAEISARVPVIADIAPIGAGLMPDLAAAGGVPAVLAALREAGLLDDDDALTAVASWDRAGTSDHAGLASGNGAAVAAQTLVGDRATTASGAPGPDQHATAAATPGAAPGTEPESGARQHAGPRWPLRSVGDPVSAEPAFIVVRGNLAPDGAVIKTAAASPELLRHSGPAVVFHSYDEMRRRVDDPELNVTADSVLVLAGCGPAGAGMPEWGNVPIPAKLLKQGVTDMVRVTDGRMSGTGYGTVVLHVAPESAVGGPLSRLRDGDIVTLDAYAGTLSVADGVLDGRLPTLPEIADRRGWPVLHRMHVTQAPEGCDYDFLQVRVPEDLPFVEPVIGRS
jgi:dihydroxyacid dehydratase/phosphogluconate dehydratase